jgi:hypothetical protein
MNGVPEHNRSKQVIKEHVSNSSTFLQTAGTTYSPHALLLERLEKLWRLSIGTVLLGLVLELLSELSRKSGVACTHESSMRKTRQKTSLAADQGQQ